MTARVPQCEADSGDGAGRLTPRAGAPRGWAEKGPGDTPCLASQHPSRERWRWILPTPQLTALLGGGEVTVAAGQGPGRGGDKWLMYCPAASPGKASPKSRLVPRWEDHVEEHGPSDTCRKEWFFRASLQSPLTWGCRETSWALTSSAVGEGRLWEQDQQL